MNDRLVARGKFAAHEHCTDATFGLGWFNSKGQGWPIKNFVGVYFDSYSSVGRIVQPLFGTSQGNERSSAPTVTFVPDGTKYDWTLEYDPIAADGRGAIKFNMNNQTALFPLPPGTKEKGAILDRFGVFNMQWANSKWCDVYLDDLEYTVSEDHQ